jgi:cadmium resistance protein CadD (predicted permease)
LAIILGLVDGFNPCAMWVLVYLISVVATLRDRKRIWLICGSFVLASGVLYFLFMTAWLNAFLFIGYVKAVTIVIGLVALGGGAWQIREVIETKGAIVCEVTGEESRKKTMTKVQEIVSSPLTFGILAGIIALAFTVNAVEFVCSAAIPAVFTQVLALSNLSTFQYYGYILLYVFFFMLDDLIIFSTAAFALTSSLGDRYAKYSRPVGATILIILGILLLGCLYSNQFEFLKPICSVLW